MKRAFAVIGFSFMLGLIICNFFLEEKSIYLTVISLVLTVVFLCVKKLRKKKELRCLFVCFLLSSALFSFIRYYEYIPVTQYVDTKCEIEATVLDTPSFSSSGNYSYLIRTKKINGEEKEVKMRLYVPYDTSAEPYDEITFSAYPFLIGSNDRGVYLHFRAKGTYVGVFTRYNVHIHTPERKPIMSIFPLLKAKVMKRLRKLLDDKHAGFAIGLLFGDKVLISTETQEGFRRVGITHIIAVSGLHMSVWVYGLYRVLKRIHFGEKRSSLISIAFSFCIVCFSSFSVSVIRAMIMSTVYLSAGLFERRSDALNSLGIAVFIICALNPFAVCDVSFLLSVFSTLGIILASRFFSSLTDTERQTKIKTVLENRPLSYVLQSLLFSVTASSFTYPIALGIFDGISVISPIANLLIVPLMTPCLLLSGFLSVFPNLTLFANTARYFLVLFENYIFFVVETLSKIPFSYVETGNLFVRVILPVLISAVLFTYFCIKEKKISATALSASASVSLVAIFYYILG